MDERWIEDGKQQISPDAKFRQDLSRALQDTHQRQRAQRQLYGASPQQRRRRSQESWLTTLAALSFVALIFGLGYYLGRRER